MWTDVIAEIKKYQANNPGAVKSFVLSKTDYQQLVTQADGLDGVKIYLGEDVKGKTTGHFIAVKKDDKGVFTDFDIPAVQINNALMPLHKEGLPCPQFCGGLNILNS